MNDLFEPLRCPVCGTPLSPAAGSLFCAGTRRHCFDVAREGYVNLAPSGAAGGGDDAALIAARTAFLSRGYYAPLAARVCEILRQFDAETVVDAGCGEGYYSVEAAKTGCRVWGFDLSKRGVKTAAKRAKTDPVSAFFGVANLFSLPFAAGVADAVICLFAPVCEAEFSRILRKGGIVIVAGAGKDHLAGLKRVLYETPVENAPRADLPQGLTLVSTETLTFPLSLDREAAAALFAMTPYFYRTPAAGRERLAALDHLDCEAQTDIFVYQKQ